MSTLNFICRSQDIETCRRRYANELYREYCEWHNSLINHMREYNRYEKTKNTALKKLERQFAKYHKHYFAEKSPKHTLNNRKSVCEFMKFNYDDFCNYIKLNHYERCNLYDCVIYYLLDSKKAVKKDFSVFSKKYNIAIARIKANISQVSFQMKELFSAYELCEYLNISYTELSNANFALISAMDVIVELKSSNHFFNPIPWYEVSLDTLGELEHRCLTDSRIIWEPIKETTFEYLLNQKIDYQINLESILSRYSKTI